MITIMITIRDQDFLEAKGSQYDPIYYYITKLHIRMANVKKNLV
jgi:hypothetical protein